MITHRERKRRVKSLGTIVMLFLIAVIVTSCSIADKVEQLADILFGKADDLTNEVTSVLDEAIGSLTVESGNWQEILKKAIEDLPKDVQSTITNEVSNLLTRSVAAVGVEVRCNADFFGNRVQQQLERIKAKFLNNPLPPIEPHTCEVVPLTIDMNNSEDRRNKIEFFGYDYDRAQITVIKVEDSHEIDVSQYLDKPTHYHMTLNLGSSGIQLGPNSQRIVVRWNNRTISTIGILQASPDICETDFIELKPTSVTYKPPLTKGDPEFSGNGPNVYASVRLVMYATRIDAEVYMLAKETKSDWTTARGIKTFTLYSVDSDKEIEKIILPGQKSSSYTYIDNNTAMDEFPGSGPVQKYKFMGDGPGNDVGYHTRVELEFNILRLQVKEKGNCVSSAAVRVLELNKTISPAILAKKKILSKTMQFKVPEDSGVVYK